MRYCKAKKTTDDNMAHAYCMRDTYSYTHTHTQYVILNVVPPQQCFTNAPHCYVTRTLPALFHLVSALQGLTSSERF